MRRIGQQVRQARLMRHLAAIIIAILPVLWLYKPLLGGNTTLTIGSTLAGQAPWSLGLSGSEMLAGWTEPFGSGDQALTFQAWEEADRAVDGPIKLRAWDRFTFSGHPSLADGQAFGAYPPRLALRALPISSVTIHDIMVVLHHAGAAIAMYGFVIARGGRRTAGVWAGWMWSLSGYVAFVTVDPFLPLFAWTPGLLCAVELALTRQERRWQVFLAFSVAMTALAGHLPMSAAVLTVGAAYAVGRVLTDRTISLTSRSVIAALCGLAIAAPIILPTLELATRGGRTQAFQATFAGVGLSDLLKGLTDSHRSAQVGWIGLWTGLPTALLGVASLAWYRDRRIWPLWGLMIWGVLVFVDAHASFLIAFVLLAWGSRRRLPLPAVLLAGGLLLLGFPSSKDLRELIPGIDLAVGRTRYYHLILVPLIALAAGSLSRILDRVEHSSLARRRVFSISTGPQHLGLKVGVAQLIVVALLVVHVPGFRYQESLSMPRIRPARSIDDYYFATPMLKAAQRAVAEEPDGSDLGRILNTAGYLIGSTSGVLGIPVSLGYESLLPPGVNELAHLTLKEPVLAAQTPRPNGEILWLGSGDAPVHLLRRLGVGALLVAPLFAPPAEWSGALVTDDAIYNGADGVLLRVRNAVPDGFLVSGIKRARSRIDEMYRWSFADAFGSDLTAVTNDLVDFRRTVSNPVPLGGTVEAEWSTGGSEVRLTVNAPEAGELVVPASWDPGWSARVKPVGKSARAGDIARVNVSQMAIEVPAGASTVVLTYDAPGYRPGLVLALLGLIGCVVIGLWPRRRGGPGSPHRSELLARASFAILLALLLFGRSKASDVGANDLNSKVPNKELICPAGEKVVQADWSRRPLQKAIGEAILGINTKADLAPDFSWSDLRARLEREGCTPQQVTQIVGDAWPGDLATAPLPSAVSDDEIAIPDEGRDSVDESEPTPSPAGS